MKNMIGIAQITYLVCYLLTYLLSHLYMLVLTYTHICTHHTHTHTHKHTRTHEADLDKDDKHNSLGASVHETNGNERNSRLTTLCGFRTQASVICGAFAVTKTLLVTKCYEIYRSWERLLRKTRVVG